jgi:hypothetical protein
MIESKREGRQRTPRMTHHNRIADAEPSKGLCEQGCLRRGCPGTVLGAIAVPETRPVEDNGPVGGSRVINHAADQHVFDHRAVAVQEHHGRAVALFNVVKTDAIDGQKLAAWQVFALGLGRPPVDKRR